VQWLRLLVAVLYTRKAGFVPWSVHVGFVIDKVIFCPDFSPSSYVVSCHYHSTVAPYSYIIWRTNIAPLVAAVQRQFRPINMDNSNKLDHYLLKGQNLLSGPYLFTCSVFLAVKFEVLKPVKI
jgi:hypothetical protein